jgi:hypothetical protein
MGQITILLLAFFDHPLPKRTPLDIRRRIGADDRQGDLAFAEIIASVLAYLGRGSAVIQKIISNLERNP